MKVSVLIPTFKRTTLLERALASVLKQTHKDWEALVVDDGDGRGLEVAASFGDARVYLLKNAGRGQVAARNTALKKAKGDLVALLDDDDWWEDVRHLELAANVLSKSAALVHSHCWMVYERDGAETHRERFALPTTPASLRENNTVIASSLVYPRTFHNDHGPFDTKVGSYWDWDWVLRVLDAGHPLTTLTTAGVCYTVHAGGASADIAKPQRLADFETFRQKHQLDVVIKNHASLLEQ